MEIKVESQMVDFGLTIATMVTIVDDDGFVIRHAVRCGRSHHEASIALQALADWVKFYEENRVLYRNRFADGAKPSAGSSASESVSQRESVPGDEANNGTVQGLGCGSHDSIMRWRPGQS